MSASAAASAAGKPNSLLIALSQPAGLKGVEFDLESGQLGLVAKGTSKYPGAVQAFVSKDAKIEHLVAIATQVQNLVDTEVQGGNKSGLDLKRISKNFDKVQGNLLNRVTRDVSPSATLAGFLQDLFPKKRSRLLKTFGKVEPSKLSAGERKRYDALQAVATRFTLINSSIDQLTAPTGATAAARGLQQGTTLLARAVRFVQGTGATSEALIAKQQELKAAVLAGRTDLQPALDMVTAVLTANDQGPAALQGFITSMKRDISSAYTLQRNSVAAQTVATGTTTQIQALYAAENDTNIRSQLENLSIASKLLDEQVARQTNPAQPTKTASDKLAAIAAGTAPQASGVSGMWHSTAGKAAHFATIALFESGYLGQALGMSANVAVESAGYLPGALSYVPTLAKYAAYAYMISPDLLDRNNYPLIGAAPAAAATTPGAAATVPPGGVFGRLGAAYGAARDALTTGAAGAPASAAAPPPNAGAAASTTNLLDVLLAPTEDKDADKGPLFEDPAALRKAEADTAAAKAQKQKRKAAERERAVAAERERAVAAAKLRAANVFGSSSDDESDEDDISWLRSPKPKARELVSMERRTSAVPADAPIDASAAASATAPADSATSLVAAITGAAVTAAVSAAAEERIAGAAEAREAEAQSLRDRDALSTAAMAPRGAPSAEMAAALEARLKALRA